MTLREKTLVVGISLVTGLLASSAVYQYIQSKINRPGSGEDGEIVITGGSVYMGTHQDWVLTGVGDILEIYDRSNNRVVDRGLTQIDVEANDTLTQYPATMLSGDTKVDVTYCNNANCNDKSDVITLQYHRTDHPYFTISNIPGNGQMGNAPIAKAARLLPNLRLLHKKNWEIYKLNVYRDGTKKDPDLACTDSNCSVVFHTLAP